MAVEALFSTSYNEDTFLSVCAPMVRYSKLGFRRLVRNYDCKLAFSPMMIANSFIRSQRARDSEFTTCIDDRPLIVQFAANSTYDFSKAAEYVASFSDGIDLNCGCPQRWAIKEQYGCHLLTEPQLVKDIVLQTFNQVPCGKTQFSVSTKIRLLPDISRSVDFCRQIESAGLSFLTIHGRKPTERSEKPNWDDVREICQSLKIPVIANGDVHSLEDGQMIHKLTHAKGIMSARGILANPGLFSGTEKANSEIITKWVQIAIETGTPFACFHHHLIYMTENLLTKPERRIFNVLTSIPAVIEFLKARNFIDLVLPEK